MKLSNAFLIIFLCLMAILYGCSNAYIDSNETKIRSLFIPLTRNDNNLVSIDFKNINTFEWDSVYFFDGETGPSSISSAIKFDWNGPDVPNLYKRILFTKDKSVTYYLDINSNNLVSNDSLRRWSLPIQVYSCRDGILSFPKSKAKFTAFKECGRGYQVYALVQEDCYKENSKFANLYKKNYNCR